MRLSVDKLGKVAITIEEGYWSNTKDYDKLTVVEAPGNEYKTYISRKPVPAGTVLTNRNYWIPFSSLREEIVLDYNTFVNLWTQNLNDLDIRVNKRITDEVDTLNGRITREVETLDNKIDTNVDTLNRRITIERGQVDATTTNLQNQIYSNDADIAELYNAVASVVAGGVALLQTFGNRTDFGISQKVLTESRDNLQAQIYTIVSEKATVSLSADPSVVIVGEPTFTLTAETDTNAQSIKITQGIFDVASGSGTNLTQELTVIKGNAGNIVYDAEFTFTGGKKRYTSTTVYFVNEIYVGSGAVYTDIVSDEHAVSAKRTPVGTYNVEVEQNGQYVFFVVPATMSINKATLSGFNFPLDAPVNQTIDNVNYKVYRSSNTNDAGTYQIIIS